MPPRFHASVSSLTDETGSERVTSLATNRLGTYIAAVTEDTDGINPNYASLLSSKRLNDNNNKNSIRSKIHDGLLGNDGVSAVAIYTESDSDIASTNSTISSDRVFVACGYVNGHVHVFCHDSNKSNEEPLLLGASKVSVSDYRPSEGGGILALDFLPTYPQQGGAVMMRIVVITEAGEFVILDASEITQASGGILQSKITTSRSPKTKKKLKRSGVVDNMLKENSPLLVSSSSIMQYGLEETREGPSNTLKSSFDNPAYLSYSEGVATMSVLSIISLPSHGNRPTELATGAMAVGSLMTLPNGFQSSYVAVGMSECSIILLADVVTPEGTLDLLITETLSVPSGVYSLSFSSPPLNHNQTDSMMLLAAGLDDGEVAFFDATPSIVSTPSFENFHFLESQQPQSSKVAISSLSFFRDAGGPLLLAIAAGSTLRVMDASTYEIFYRFTTRNQAKITSVQFVVEQAGLSKQSKIVLARDDGIVDLVHLRCWDQLLGDIIHPGNVVTSMDFASDYPESLIIASGRQLLIYETKVWDLPKTMSYSVSAVQTLELPEKEIVTRLAYSPNTQYIAAATQHTETKEYFLTLFTMTQDNTRQILHTERSSTYDISSKVNALSFTPNSQSLLVGTDNLFVIYDLNYDETGPSEIFGSDEKVKMKTDSDSVACACWSSDGSMVAVGYSKELQIFSTETFKQLSQINIESSALAFNTESDTLAIGTQTGSITTLKKDSSSSWVKALEDVPHRGSVSSLQFSNDSPSSFLATIGSYNSCQVYSCTGNRYLLVQDIESKSFEQITCFSFDVAGNTLVIGGKCSNYGEGGGAIMAVRVGELLRGDWFPLAFAENDIVAVTPQLACKKLSELGSIDRAQLLYHRPFVESNGTSEVVFLLERSIQQLLRKQKELGSKANLGSYQLKCLSDVHEVHSYLQEILNKFPLSIFATTTQRGNIFDIALQRRDPRFLKLALHTSLISCRIYPHVLMNDTMRGGIISQILIKSCYYHPYETAEILRNIKWWPSFSMSSKKPFFLEGKRAIIEPHTSPDLKHLFHDHTDQSKGGTLAIPMLCPVSNLSSLAFLSAIINNCPPVTFSKKELSVLVEYLWNKYVKLFFLLEFFVFIVFVLFWGTFVMDSNGSNEVNLLNGIDFNDFKGISAFVIFFLNILFGIKELTEFLMFTPDEHQQFVRKETKMQNALSRAFSPNVLSDRHLRSRRLMTALTEMWKFLGSKYWKSWWNLCNCFTWWMVNISLFLNLKKESSETGEFAVITTLFIMFKFLGYFRGFGKSGWVLVVLHEQYVAAQGFLVVILSTLCGFAVIFNVLLGSVSDDYNTYLKTFLTVVNVGIIGSFDFENVFEQNLGGILTRLFIIMVVAVVFIVGMNGFVALMIEAYERVKKNKGALLSHQRATLVLTYLKLFPKKKTDRLSAEMKYFFCLAHIDHHHGVSSSIPGILATIDERKRSLLPTKVQ